MARAAISIDLDCLDCYGQIHGIPLAETGVTYQKAVPRFLEFLDKHAIRGTLFCVGRDALKEKPAGILRRAAQTHELASHSQTHPYHFRHLTREQLTLELRESKHILSDLAGKPVVGFRAPGYQVGSGLLSCLREEGYTYDSSLLPAPLYWLARAAALGWGRLQRRASRTEAGPLRAFWGTTNAYRASMEFPWKESPHGFPELPMAASLGLPFIGTSFALLPENLLRVMARDLQKKETLVIEFHALDFLDSTDDPQLAALALHQPDLRKSLVQRLRRYERVVRTLSGACEWMTLKTLSANL